MTRGNSLYRLIMTVILLAVPLIGCSQVQPFNDDFLDFFGPFGTDFTTQMDPEGPLIIVIQNLTRATSANEFVDITIHYEGSDGRGGGAITTILLAVPEGERPDNKRYRSTFVLDCKDITRVWITATISRLSIIEEEVEGVFVGEPETFYFATAGEGVFAPTFSMGPIVDPATLGPDRESSTHAVCRPDRTEGGATVREDVPVVNTFAAFQRDIHFECGSVLIFGITEGRDEHGSINWKSYECDYFFGTFMSSALRESLGADIVLFESGLTDAELEQIEDDGLLDLWAAQGDGALTEEQMATINEFKVREDFLFSEYIFDPGRFLVQAIYPYPNTYMTVGIALPQMTDLDSITAVLLEQIARLQTDAEPGPAKAGQ